MKKNMVSISLVLILAAFLFIGNEYVYGAAGGFPNVWGVNSTPPTGGVKWTGTLVVTGRIVDVPGLPTGLSGLPLGLPASSLPVDPSLYKDQIVKLEFFVRLQNKNQGAFTFSGLGVDNQGYYLFYALGDYLSNGRMGEALNNFLINSVYPNLPPNYKSYGYLTSLTDDQSNVDLQLSAQGNLQAGTPLFLNASITAVTYAKPK